MRVVIALGDNALLRRGQPMSEQNQRENVRVVSKAMGKLAREHQVVITHGNGHKWGYWHFNPLRIETLIPIRWTCWVLNPRG